MAWTLHDNNTHNKLIVLWKCVYFYVPYKQPGWFNDGSQLKLHAILYTNSSLIAILNSVFTRDQTEHSISSSANDFIQVASAKLTWTNIYRWRQPVEKLNLPELTSEYQKRIHQTKLEFPHKEWKICKGANDENILFYRKKWAVRHQKFKKW